MPFEPIDPLGGFTATDALPKPQESVLPDPTTSETFGAAFRTDNTIGSLFASEDAHFAGTRIDPDFDPWGAIAGTPYEPYYENFARAANKEHFEAIKSDIDRENKDRDIMGRSGWTGLGASLVAGTVDWPIIIPGGQVVRSAKGGVSLLKTALSTGVAGGIAGAASEVMLQNTQQLRTAEESAMVIGGSAVLSGILGAGIGKLVARSDFDALAPRIERDLTVPGVDKPDHFEPGSFGAKVEAAPGASAQATAIADALRQTASEILPPQVRVQVVDSLGPVGDDGLYAIRAADDADDIERRLMETRERLLREEWEAADRIRKEADEADAKVRMSGEARAKILAANDTPEFASWFSGSKTVEADGKPQILFHGTSGDIQAFDPMRANSNTQTGVPEGTFFFSSSPRNAATYAGADGGNVMPVFVALKDPFIVDAGGKSWLNIVIQNRHFDTNELSALARDQGFDGVIVRNVRDSSEGSVVGDTVIAFKPEQIKSAIGNRGTFDPADARIAYGVRSTPSGPIAEGRFDPNKLLITIAADALDPLKTLHHESIHALKQMGLFTAKEWQTLEAAAKKRGWLETHNVRSLYEGVYKGRRANARFSVRDGGDYERVQSQLEAIFDRWTDPLEDIPGRWDDRDPYSLPSLRKASEQIIDDIKRAEGMDARLDEIERIKDGMDDSQMAAYDRLTDEAESLSSDVGGIYEKWGASDSLPSLRARQKRLMRDLDRAEALVPRFNELNVPDDELFSLRGNGTAPAGAQSSLDPKLESLLIEEAIAEQFSLWRQGASKITGVIAKLFERMQQFLERTGNALRGRGFQTADDVFEAIGGGDVAMRVPGARVAPSLTTTPGMGRGASVGAAARDRADDALKSAFGMEKAMSFQDPMLRLQTSPSPVSNRHVQELAETPLTYGKNVLGEETAPLGTELGAPGAVESRVKIWTGALFDAVESVDEQWLRYREVWGKNNLGKRRALTLRDTLFGSEALTHKQFKTEVSKSLRRKDTHTIPEVAAAARDVRQKLLDPLKDEAIKAELLPEGVSVETAESYLMRLYNKDLIIAERDQFKKVVADWLTEQETINAGVRSRLAPLLERIERSDGEIARLEERIPKREVKLKELEARAEEAARVQQLAFKRALDRREPIEALQGRIADLGDQIADQMDTLSAMKALDKNIGDMQAIARGMREGQGGDLAAQLADVAELEEGIDGLLVKAEADIERISEVGDLPLPSANGAHPQAPLAIDEIEDIAASWRAVREAKAARKPEGLTRFVVRMGGVEDPGGDVLAMIGRTKDRPGLIRKSPEDVGPALPGVGAGDRLNTLDAMALRAWENGFFPGRTERPTINEFLDALREDFTGNAVVRGDDEARMHDLTNAEKLAQDLEERGVRVGDFRTEGSLRVFLGQSPREAMAGEAGGGLKALRLMKKQLAEIVSPYRSSISKLTKEARKRERNESLRQSERGVFATQARNRGRTIADQVASRRAELDKMRSDLEARQASVIDAQTAIEAEVTKYQGKSASEAKSAMERRADAELERTAKREETVAKREQLVARIASEERALLTGAPLQRPSDPRLDAIEALRKELAAIDRSLADPKRLRGADKPVLAAARKIADQIDKEPGEIQDLADQIIDRIIGTPDGRLPYDAHMDKVSQGGATMDARGPLAARSFMIPDAAIERWLENDIETIMRAYTRTMAPDVELTKRFGSADMKLQMKEIQDDYARRSRTAKTSAERKKINDQRKADIRDLAAIRDRIRGTYALPSNPDGYLVRTGRVVSSLNYMRMLGGMTLSAIPDLGGIVLHHGVMNTVGDGIIPLFRNWSGARLARGEVKRAGTALEMVLDSRAMSMADIMDDHGRHTKFERGVQAAARNFGIVSLQSQWNSGLKQFTGLVTMTRMLRAAEAVASGKIKPRELERLAAAGISQSNARKIAEQFAKRGSKDRGVWFANTAQWDAGSRQAIDAFRVALVRDVDRIIITPGQDRPLWMSTEMGRLIGQFKSFSIAAMQRIVIAGLQQRDMGTLNGIILMTALGGLVGILKAKVAGQPVHSEWSDKKKNAQFLVEAIDRSGLTGWLMEVNSMTEKMSGGAIGLSAITGKPVSRYAQRNIASSILGPSIGTIEDAYRVTKKAAQREWTQSDSRVMRRLIPYNNIFYARAMFDKAEAGINGFFGVPKPAGGR